MTYEARNKIAKEGWYTNHPTSDKRVEVVNAEYCTQVEKENKDMKRLLRKILAAHLKEEFECLPVYTNERELRHFIGNDLLIESREGKDCLTLVVTQDGFERIPISQCTGISLTSKRLSLSDGNIMGLEQVLHTKLVLVPGKFKFIEVVLE